jgi:hypothetical protein
MAVIKSLKVALMASRASQVELLTGGAGNDVGHVVVIQHFKGLADNGALNERIWTRSP